MFRPALAHSLPLVERLGLTFDALVKPPHLDALTAFVDRYPNLPVVVDHGAKPEIAKGREGFEAWAPRWPPWRNGRRCSASSRAC